MNSIWTGHPISDISDRELNTILSLIRDTKGDNITLFSTAVIRVAPPVIFRFSLLQVTHGIYRQSPTDEKVCYNLQMRACRSIAWSSVSTSGELVSRYDIPCCSRGM